MEVIEGMEREFNIVEGERGGEEGEEAKKKGRRRRRRRRG